MGVRGIENPWSNLLGYILQVENVRLVDRSLSRRTQVGTLYLTATHTIFVGKGSEDRNELWVSACHVRCILLPLMFVVLHHCQVFLCSKN